MKITQLCCNTIFVEIQLMLVLVKTHACIQYCTRMHENVLNVNTQLADMPVHSAGPVWVCSIISSKTTRQTNPVGHVFTFPIYCWFLPTNSLRRLEHIRAFTLFWFVQFGLNLISSCYFFSPVFLWLG